MLSRIRKVYACRLQDRLAGRSFLLRGSLFGVDPAITQNIVSVFSLVVRLSLYQRLNPVLPIVYAVSCFHKVCAPSFSSFFSFSVYVNAFVCRIICLIFSPVSFLTFHIYIRDFFYELCSYYFCHSLTFCLFRFIFMYSDAFYLGLASNL